MKLDEIKPKVIERPADFIVRRIHKEPDARHRVGNSIHELQCRIHRKRTRTRRIKIQSDRIGTRCRNHAGIFGTGQTTNLDAKHAAGNPVVKGKRTLPVPPFGVGDYSARKTVNQVRKTRRLCTFARQQC